jgi:hypothetical protein
MLLHAVTSGPGIPSLERLTALKTLYPIGLLWVVWPNARSFYFIFSVGI